MLCLEPGVFAAGRAGTTRHIVELTGAARSVADFW